jgi:hypothetical protein
MLPNDVPRCPRCRAPLHAAFHAESYRDMRLHPTYSVTLFCTMCHYSRLETNDEPRGADCPAGESETDHS